MADILRVTAPLVQPSQIPPTKSTDPTLPFNTQDLSKVIRSGPQSELLGQNNGLAPKDDAPTILMNLLRDPAVTVHFLKNIFLLQEIIRLLPANNNPVTAEIQQMFRALLVGPDDIVKEMLRQEQTTTQFRGEIYDMLRKLLGQNPSSELRGAALVLLKAINGQLNKQELLGSVSNTLGFLADALSSSKSLSQRLAELSARFSGQGSENDFASLRKQALELLHEVEGSILFSGKLAKVVSITHYNLSRFQDNPDFLGEAIANFLSHVNGKQERSEMLQCINDFLSSLGSRQPAEHSRVMDVLADIIGKQTGDPAINLVNEDKIEKIIHSLLSSPCNFTPLLHFVVPVEYEDLRAFAEIWVDPQAGQEGQTPQTGQNIQMLIVFDIETFGQFEAELMVKGENIDFTLRCPTGCYEAFSAASGRFSALPEGSPYKLRQISVERLEASRSLMDVFKSLPYKRTGVDVKI